MSSTASTTSHADWTTIQNRALAFAGVGIVICAFGALLSPPHFLRAYLVAWNFWAGISLGSLALLLIQYLTGGAWGLLLRRFLEAAAQNILLLAVLFPVIAIGLPTLYEWARPEVVEHSAALQQKAAYLNPQAFVVRAAIYFILWIALSWLLRSWSLKQDRIGPSLSLAERCATIAGPGLVIYGITVTFASIDWVMSLEPLWYSSIFPPLYAAGQILSALSFSVAALLWLSDRSPLTRTVLPAERRDLGNLMLAFVMLWAYMSFSQFLIIWSENLPEETPWYLHRLRGGWEWLALALIVLQFALPFLLLLSRERKQSAGSLTKIALLILAMRFVDIFWWVQAAFSEPVSFYWLLDLAALAAIGGIWVWCFARQLQSHALLPTADPYLHDYLPEVSA